MRYGLVRATPHLSVASAHGLSATTGAPFPASQCSSYDADGNCTSYGPADFPGGVAPASPSTGGFSAWLAANPMAPVYGLGFLLLLMLGGRRR